MLSEKNAKVFEEHKDEESSSLVGAANRSWLLWLTAAELVKGDGAGGDNSTVMK